MNKGWHRERYEHSLASKGIKTKVKQNKAKDYIKLSKSEIEDIIVTSDLNGANVKFAWKVSDGKYIFITSSKNLEDSHYTYYDLWIVKRRDKELDSNETKYSSVNMDACYGIKELKKLMKRHGIK